MAKLDRDRKAGLVCIALMFEFLTAGYFCKDTTIAGIFALIGVGFFTAVMVLMARSVDKKGFE